MLPRTKYNGSARFRQEPEAKYSYLAARLQVFVSMTSKISLSQSGDSGQMTARSTRVVGYIFIFLTCLACQGAIAQTCKPNENTAFGEWFDASIQLKGDQRNQS